MNKEDVSSLHRYAIRLAIVITFFISATTSADNLLINSDFNQDKTDDKDFGWTIELAKDQQSAFSVVAGRDTESRTLRICNDELGRSFIRQVIAVQPWRWYVAEVWVKSDGMYSPDVRVSLIGGRKRGQWQYHMDYFHRPKSGWRVIRAFDHAGDSERLILTIGGNAFSGELLVSEPVVRECSLVEAASYHANPNSRNPGVYGPPVDISKGLPGYAFLRSDVRRVARGFPNALKISLDLADSKDDDGRVSLWLPLGIRYLKLRPHVGGKISPKVTRLPVAQHAPRGTHLELYTGRGESNLLVDSDLEPGGTGNRIRLVRVGWRLSASTAGCF